MCKFLEAMNLKNNEKEEAVSFALQLAYHVDPLFLRTMLWMRSLPSDLDCD